MSAPAVAAFDVDGTLTTGDCVMPFLRMLAGTAGLLAAVARRPLALASGVVRLDRDALKEVVVGQVFRGRVVDDVAAMGKEFAAEIERTRLRDDVVARLRWHQQERHRTLLLSASLRPYLQPLAASLGVDDVLCTDVATESGRYTARLLGGNCRGRAKLVRLDEWRAAEGLDDAPLWAYGDARSDRYVLETADHPVWVTDATVLAVPEGSVR